MIKILPIKNDDLAYYNQKANTNCRHGFAVTEQGVLLGYSLYDFSQTKATIAYAQINDPLLFDGLLRTTLFSIMEQGIDCAAFSKQVDHSLLVQLGFVEKDQNETDSLLLFFTQKKCAHC